MKGKELKAGNEAGNEAGRARKTLQKQTFEHFHFFPSGFRQWECGMSSAEFGSTLLMTLSATIHQKYIFSSLSSSLLAFTALPEELGSKHNYQGEICTR